MTDCRARGQDWGSYVRWDGAVLMPFARLVELGLCHYYIGKGGQSGPGLSTKANLAAARAAGVPVVGCFYWLDPCNAPEYDIAHVCALVTEEAPDLVVLDIEQWWSNWQKYQAAIDRLIGWGEVPHFTPQALSEHYRKVSQGVKEAFPDKKVTLYTSRAFVVGWAAPMVGWLADFNGGMVASWPDYGKTPYYLAWEAIQSYPAADLQPDLPPGWSTWSIWQTSSRIKPLEFQGDFGRFDHNYDWSVFNGTPAELLSWAGLKPVEPPPAEDPPLAELSDHDKLVKLWNAHPELHPQAV